jgi:peptidoglycan/xylan/chitin deacetylase (PgdA/CDA1 family)
MWELNYSTPELLAARGFVYDSSLMADDVPYRLAISADPAAGSLIEIPPHWSLDDGEQYAWLPWIWDTAPIESPTKVTEMWGLDFAAAVDEGGCLVLTIHPCLSGRPGRAAALERLLERIVGTPGVWVATAGEVAAYAAQLDLPAVFHAPPRPQQGDLPQPRPTTGTAP